MVQFGILTSVVQSPEIDICEIPYIITTHQSLGLSSDNYDIFAMAIVNTKVDVKVSYTNTNIGSGFRNTARQSHNSSSAVQSHVYICMVAWLDDNSVEGWRTKLWSNIDSYR